MLKTIVFIFAFSVIPRLASAFAASPLMTLGGELGGEKISQISGKPVESLSAGTGIYFSLGAKLDIVDNEPHSYEARIHLGLNAAESQGGEDRLSTWTSIPLNLEYFYVNRRNQFKIGYGLTYRFSNSLDSERSGVKNDFRFKATFGYTLSIERYSNVPSGHLSTGIRYTSITYSEATSGQPFRGDSIGVYFVMSIDVEKTEDYNRNKKREELTELNKI